MTLEQLKMLKLVAELGSLKSASAILFKTQPAISQGIKQLESQLNLQLFNRQGYRLVLTDEGQKIYQYALRLLKEADEIKQVASVLASGNEASFTLAIEAAFDLTKILPLLATLQKEFPHTQIILQQEYISGAFEAVLSQQADIAISVLDDHTLQSNDIENHALYQSYLCNVAAPSFLQRHPNLSLVEELRDEYQIVVKDSGKKSKGLNYGVQSGQRCWYVNDFFTKKTLILSGIGWGRLPDYIIKEELKNNSLQEIKLTDYKTRVALSYQVLKLKSRLLGPVADKLWQNLSLVNN